MNDYKELVEMLRNMSKAIIREDAKLVDIPEENIWDADANAINDAADAIEQLVREINYCPTDTLRKYHAWLLEQFHNNPTSEILHSTDTAIGWLKAYAEYRDINVSFGIGNGEV